MPRRLLGAGAAAAALLLAGCSGKAADDDALACSITSNWVTVLGEFQPRGKKSRRLSAEERRLVNDSAAWRPLTQSRHGASSCGPPRRAFENLKVSRDGQWAVADFPSEWSVERCLARRAGDRWVQRECDVVVHIEPVLQQLPEPRPPGAAGKSDSTPES
jgi:hypothetical protein